MIDITKIRKLRINKIENEHQGKALKTGVERNHIKLSTELWKNENEFRDMHYNLFRVVLVEILVSGLHERTGN